MTLEGKKKFTTTISAMVVGFIGLLVTNGIIGDQVAATATQVAAVGLPLACAFIYDIMQGLHDRKKEEVKKVEVEVEKRFLMEKEKPAPPPPARKPNHINFATLTKEVLERVEKDDQQRPKALSLYYALIDEGKETELDSLPDVWEYANLVVDAADRKFEEIHGFSLNDPELTEKLRTVGKCPYSTADAFCAYEGNRVALRDVRNAKRDRDGCWQLVEMDGTDNWRTNFDTSLYGIMTGARRLVSQLS